MVGGVVVFFRQMVRGIIQETGAYEHQGYYFQYYLRSGMILQVFVYLGNTPLNIKHDSKMVSTLERIETNSVFVDSG